MSTAHILKVNDEQAKIIKWGEDISPTLRKVADHKAESKWDSRPSPGSVKTRVMRD